MPVMQDTAQTFEVTPENFQRSVVDRSRAAPVVRDGQIIHQFDGAQSQAALRALLEDLTRSPGERLGDELAALIDAGEYDRALDLVRAVLADEPHSDALRVELADLLVLRGELEPALELLLELLRVDRTFRDDIGRLTMVRIFKLLGKGSELASRYRRRMFNYLH
jgi:thioredoxin-like negative regulator of GroEL